MYAMGVVRKKRAPSADGRTDNSSGDTIASRDRGSKHQDTESDMVRDTGYGDGKDREREWRGRGSKHEIVRVL